MEPKLTVLILCKLTYHEYCWVWGMAKLYNIAWRLKRKARSQPNKNGFAKWLGHHKLLLADKTLLVSYFSLSPSLLPPLPHSPNDALCSIANALQVLVPLLDREHRITHPGRVETRRKRHLCNSRSWQSGCDETNSWTTTVFEISSYCLCPSMASQLVSHVRP